MKRHHAASGLIDFEKVLYTKTGYLAKNNKFVSCSGAAHAFTVFATNYHVCIFYLDFFKKLKSN